MALRLSSGALRSESEIIFSLHVSRRCVSAGLATSRQDSIGIKEGKQESKLVVFRIMSLFANKIAAWG